MMLDWHAALATAIRAAGVPLYDLPIIDWGAMQVAPVYDATATPEQIAKAQAIINGWPTTWILCQARDAATARSAAYWQAITDRHAAEQATGVPVSAGTLGNITLPYAPQNRSDYHQLSTVIDQLGNSTTYTVWDTTGTAHGNLANDAATTLLNNYMLAALGQTNRQIAERNVGGGQAGDLARIEALYAAGDLAGLQAWTPGAAT